MKPNLIVLGAPGSGKGTQAIKLAKDFGFKHLSTGDLLRAEIEKKSELGNRVQGIISRGDLVNDETVLELLKVNYSKGESALLDGFPRNIKQAQMLDDQLFTAGDLVKAVYFEVDLNLLKERIVNRRTCKKCGEIYNIKTKPYNQDGSCSKCGSSEITQRKDDTEEVVDNRLSVFRETFEPVLDFYKKTNRLLTVNAGQPEADVFKDLKKIIDL